MDWQLTGCGVCTLREQLSVACDKDTVLRVIWYSLVQTGSFTDRSGARTVQDGCRQGMGAARAACTAGGCWDADSPSSLHGEQVRGRSVGHGHTGKKRHQSHPQDVSCENGRPGLRPAVCSTPAVCSQGQRHWGYQCLARLSSLIPVSSATKHVVLSNACPCLF